MATYTPRRLQRSNKNPQLSYQQFLVFAIADEQFALPIESIYKVIQSPKIYGDPHRRGFGLITYQGEQVIVIDLEQHLLGRSRLSGTEATAPLESAHFLILMKVEQPDHGTQLLGLPVEQPPQLQRLSQQKITSLPDSYLRWGDIHGVTSVSVQDVETAEQHPTFILEPTAVLSTLANQEIIVAKQPQLSESLASGSNVNKATSEEILDAVIHSDQATTFDLDRSPDLPESLLPEDDLESLPDPEFFDHPELDLDLATEAIEQPLVEQETLAAVTQTQDEQEQPDLVEPESIALESLPPLSEPPLAAESEVHVLEETIPEVPDLTDLPDLDLADVAEILSLDLDDDLQSSD
ncbi:chemotaxis protein CheW [Synechococcus elongatus]|uniref:chemotaxis protein CheW n=1 Tax=Synechococcus elongatus TaxID=32046 RepID=UPI0030CF90AF